MPSATNFLDTLCHFLVGSKRPSSRPSPPALQERFYGICIACHIIVGIYQTRRVLYLRASAGLIHKIIQLENFKRAEWLMAEHSPNGRVPAAKPFSSKKNAKVKNWESEKNVKYTKWRRD